MPGADSEYTCFADLAAAQVEGADFRISVRHRPQSKIAVIAPHGGAIEAGTSEIASAVAGCEFNLYLFEGLSNRHCAALHLTSHRFDEPRCLALVSGCEHVIAIHGCRGGVPQALLGGLDRPLQTQIGTAIAGAGIESLLTGHQYRAVHPRNICNRGRRGAGVQVELTSALRLGQGKRAIVTAIRSVLLGL